jgi:hypothetical protein
MEEYKIIKNFENYLVSNFGNIKNNKTNRLLKQHNHTKGYKQIEISGKKKFIHRLVAEAFIPNPENKPCVDHINNIRDDNRIENLRWASINENNQNKSMSKYNTSGFKGVFFDKTKNKWRAEIGFNGKSIKIGRFDTKEEANNARVKKAKELFTNYINDCEKEVNINIKLPKNTKLNINIEIIDEEYLKLEKELEELIK